MATCWYVTSMISHRFCFLQFDMNCLETKHNWAGRFMKFCRGAWWVFFSYEIKHEWASQTRVTDPLDKLICTVAVGSDHVTPSLLSSYTGSYLKSPLIPQSWSAAGTSVSDNRAAERQRSHGESRAESGADHRLLLRYRPEDGRDAGKGSTAALSW